MKYIIIETYAQNSRYNIGMPNQEMDHIYNTSEADKATKLNSQKWMTYFVMQIFQKLDKFSMLEGLVSILAEKVLH